MSNELMLIQTVSRTVSQTVSEVGQAVSALAMTVRTFGTIRKRDAVVLEEGLIYLKHVCRAKGYGALARQSVDEMAETYEHIVKKNLSGSSLNMAMQLLELQWQALRENIQAYTQK